MSWYQDLSIRYKLQGMVIAACGAGLLVASLAFTWYDRTTFLSSKTADLRATAKMIGANSTAALAFRDAASARETLSALGAKPYVARACIYDSAGAAFAAYTRATGDAHPCPPSAQLKDQSDRAGHMAVSEEILIAGDAIGAIYIESDLKDLHDRLQRFVLIDLVVLLGSLAVAYLLSYRLQRVISGPIRELARTASSVSVHEDYSIRATRRSRDEIGVLFEQFNSMLDRIQQRDVAVQKAHDSLEKRVEERTAFLNALIENSPLAMMVLDSEENVQLCNPAFEYLFQYARAEVIGKPVDGLLADGEFLVEARGILLRAGSAQAVRQMSRRKRKDGSLVDVEIHAVGLLVNAQPSGTLVLYQDISVRKRAEEAMQQAREAAEASSKAKSEFLANMSHEIRTPMNGIMGMTELVLDTQLDAEQREYLTMAKSSADALLTLINDILDYSKMEAGKVEIETVEFLLGNTLGDTVKALGLRAHEKGLELTCEIRPDVPVALLGDPGQLRQVLVNLLGNAIKFTSTGEVTLVVEAEERTAQEIQLHFTVADSGIGIPAEKQAAIFEAFTQADGSMSRTYGGTGLGLTISSRLVALMHGRIWVESERNQGSRFHFTARFGLPQGLREATVPAAPAVLEGMPVLVVDDNRTNLEILVKFMAGWQARPVPVESGAAALAALRLAHASQTGFPLIVVDAQMPEMDGFALVETILKNPDWRTATIMMLTSAGRRGDLRRCKELGIAAYLSKPIRKEELLAAVLIAVGARPVAAAPRAPVHRDAPGGTGPALRLLLAEDNAVNQKLAQRLLEKRGHTVTVAANGREALAALGRKVFDLVLMDVQMPEMDGFEATAAIREQEKTTGERLPIIAMTAHAMAGDRERCLAAGMDDYISKPIRPEELSELLRRYAPVPSV